MISGQLVTFLIRFVTRLLPEIDKLNLMNTRAAPLISSFVIRFVMEDKPVGGKSHLLYRGSIRHVQSAEELNFSVWAEAVEFIRRFVPLEQSDRSEPHS